jgi:O-antigen ligase
VQNAYVQALADTGLVGFALFVGLLGVGIRLSLQTARRAPSNLASFALVSLTGLLVVIGGSTALGLVAGIPLDALLWLSLGFAVTLAEIVGRTRTPALKPAGPS